MVDRRAVNRSMFWRVLRRSIFANRGRLLVILLALGAGAAVTAALLNLQVDAKRRIATEFRAFGPNVLIVPRSSAEAAGVIHESLLERLAARNGGAEFAATPYLYLVSQIESENRKRESVVAGTHLDLLENREPGWKLEPQHPSEYAPGECVVGVRLADQLKARAGTLLRLSANGREESCTVASVLSSGGAEDDQVFAPLAAAQRLAGESGRISMAKLFVGGDAARINKTIANLQAGFPDVEVRAVRQFTEGESRLYGKISGVLSATVAVVLLLTALCVMAAMTNVAMERKNDVGLMKAIGGSVRRVLRLFLAEAVLLGLAGGLIGAAVGIVLSIGLGKAVFGVAAQPRLIVYPVSVALTVMVAILAAYPLRRLVQIRPASVFRGEE
ncbi:MAG TPA: ABC transporter permease [Candidatus Acidoferrum sp.]|nr:ABC transporter permease [Candidatus Acidoferrum sp.]